MITRLTTADQIKPVIATARQIVADMESAGITPIAGQDINWGDVEKFLSYYIGHPDKMLCLISDNSVFVADAAPVWYNEKITIAGERIWFSAKPGAGAVMIRRYVNWARNEAMADIITLTSQRKSGRVDNFLSRMGFAKQGDDWRMTNGQ